MISPQTSSKIEERPSVEKSSILDEITPFKITAESQKSPKNKGFSGVYDIFYLWGLDLSGSEQGAGGVGGLLAVTDHVNDSTSYALSDGNGNVTGYVDSQSGGLVYSVEYSPFGKVLVENGEPVSDYGLSTKLRDEETGYIYYNYVQKRDTCDLGLIMPKNMVAV